MPVEVGQPKAATAQATSLLPGGGSVVPPASVPLGFLAAGGVGLWAFGFAAALAADRVVATGFTAAVAGTLASSPTTVAVGGGGVSIAGALVTANLALGPRRMARRQHVHASDKQQPPSGARRTP